MILLLRLLTGQARNKSESTSRIDGQASIDRRRLAGWPSQSAFHGNSLFACK